MPKSKKNDRSVVRMTAELQQATRKLTPCAKTLWIWMYLRSQPDTLLEINLKDFADQYNYGLPWIKKCYQELIEHGFWEEKKRWYGGRDYRGIVIDPTDPNS